MKTSLIHSTRPAASGLRLVARMRSHGAVMASPAYESLLAMLMIPGAVPRPRRHQAWPAVGRGVLHARRGGAAGVPGAVSALA